MLTFKNKRISYFFGTSFVLAIVFLSSILLQNNIQVAGALGISLTSATKVINLIQAYQTLAAVVTVVGALSGIGSVTSGIVATVLYLLKKEAKAKVALW
ncbi:MAG: uberolysin/carnocyclin family circular bacteriocin [Lactobacillaceae bacterium]|jgi:circularin A/uberolysin family circular bacteriocin|nr:uberolysin/carnocyclin family circular bacteriocin [Lactobacillaceae bacterium]